MANPLTGWSAAVADLVQGAEGFVVRVEGGRRIPSSGILWNTDGVVITAAHAVRHEQGLRVFAAGAEGAEAELVGVDPGTDLAVLRAAGMAGTPETAAARAAAPESIRVGHLVFALGRPGRTLRTTHGIVSALGESWRTPAGATVDRYLEVDASLPAGFSGGPLLDAAGALLGMNTSAVPRGLGTTIPVPTIGRVLEAILAHGRVRRAYLGVNTYPAPLPEPVQRQEGRSSGLLITEVESGSPAERAGLGLGDVLLSLDGQPITGLEDLFAVLSAERAGKTVTVRVLRAGQVQELQAALGERG